MKTIVADYSVRNTHYVIVQDANKMFWAIDRKYINENGQLNVELNGITGHASMDLSETLKRAKQQADCNYYISLGLPRMEAICKALNIEEV